MYSCYKDNNDNNTCLTASRTTWVSRHQKKDKPFRILMKQQKMR